MRDGNIVKTVRSYQTKLAIINIYIMLGPILFFKGFLDMFIWAVFDIVICGGGVMESIIGIVLGVSCFLIVKPKEKLEKEFKEFTGAYITKDILAEKMEIIKYLPTDMINRKSIKASGIMPRYDRIEGSDYIKATYKGQEIEYCDYKLEEEHITTDDDGSESTSYEVVFQGPFVRIPLGKKISGHVKIIERRSKRKKKGLFSDLIDSAADMMGIKRDSIIELENEAFNNQFEVKTNDEELAFYILTPQFMENIIKADEYADGYTNISFTDEVVYIAINNGKDAFEVKKTMYSVKGLEKARADMRQERNFILAVIDEILEKDRLFM